MLKNIVFKRCMAILVSIAMVVQIPCIPLVADLFNSKVYAAPESQAILPQEICQLADDFSTLEIYEYVKNNFKSQFYYKSQKEVKVAFDEKSGNDYDLSVLLSEMLRYKGIETRYCTGFVKLNLSQVLGMTGASTPDGAARVLAAQGIPTTVITSQGKISAIQIERIWVEAYIPYENYRGIGNGRGPKTWVPLDGAFKMIDGDGDIIPETLGLFPASLPYRVASISERFEDIVIKDEQAEAEAPVINHDIPFSMTLGESYECTVTATAMQGIKSLTVTLNGDVVPLSPLGTFTFTASEYGTYLFAIKAIGGDDKVRTVTHTLSMERISPEDMDTICPQLNVRIDSGEEASLGNPVYIYVNASDNSGKVFIDVKVNGMTAEGDEGVYFFTPDAFGSYNIIVVASDSAGNYIKKTYVHSISQDQTIEDVIPPQLNVTYIDSDVAMGETMRINIDATDDSGEVSVRVTANGEEVPYEDGVARFTPQSAGSYEIIVEAQDSTGNGAIAKFTVEVTSVSGKPHLYILINEGLDKVNIGDKVILQVGGVGLSKEYPITLKLNENNLILNKFGEAEFTPLKAGIYKFSAFAKDLNGNELSVSDTLKVLSTEGTELPQLEITGISEGAEVTGPTDILGTIGAEGLSYYTLSYADSDSEDFTVFAQGDQPTENTVLGTFDPTLLQNGYYTIRLMGYGAAGIEYDEITLSVQGKMKIGNYSVAFQDMIFPVMNFPLTVTRGYDSRDKNKSGDFGYGWNMELSGAKLSESCAPGRHWGQEPVPIDFGLVKYRFTQSKIHEVSIDWGNGITEKFAMELSPREQSMIPITHNISVSYKPLGYTTSKLEAVGTTSDLIYNGGRLLNSTDLNVYQPQKYKLTAQDGTVYIIGASRGVESISDVQGNQITINKNGLSHSDGKSIFFIRDDKNRITKLLGPTGKEVSYAYDLQGNLVKMTDVAGGTTEFLYDKNHYLLEMKDPRGVRVARNEYDEQGRIVAVVDADGKRTTFDNDISGRRQVVTDRLGYSTLYVYDERGNILSQTDANGIITTNTYDSNGQLSARTDALGNVTHFQCTPDGKLISSTDSLGNEIKNTYDTKGMLLSVSAMNSIQMVSTYNQYGNPTKIKDALDNETTYAYDSKGLVSSITDKIGTYMAHTRDSEGNVTALTNGNGETATFTYDEDGNCLSKTETRTGSSEVESITENYTYDNAGRVTSVLYSDGSTLTLSYDKVGRLSEAIDSKNRKTSFSYDLTGNLVEVVYSDQTKETFDYDKEGRNVKATDRLGREVTLSYDKVGNLTTKTYPNGASIKYEYDNKYRIVSITDAAGSKTSYKYDDLDRNTEVIDALGHTVSYSYDELSRVNTMTDARGNTYAYTYDANGNRTSIILPDGSSITATYDARSRLLSQEDQSGYTTAYEYDGADRLTSVTDAMGNAWNYGYDEIGNLVHIEDPANNSTYYEYDELGRVVKTQNQLGQEATATYDLSGCLTSSTDYAGVTTFYSYDEMDRLIKKDIAGKVTEFAYTPDGKLDAVTDERGKTSYTYDVMDGLTSVRTPDDVEVRYTYDKAMRLTSVKTPYQMTFYGYDALSRLAEVEDELGITTYQYDANGNRIQMKYSNGIKVIYEYDDLNRLQTEEILHEDGTALASYTYTLGDAGQRLKVNETDFDGKERSLSYTYDKLYRLTGETIYSGGITETTTYTYDALSNRTSKIKNGVTTEYTYNALNQLVNETGIQYTYDHNGNLIQQDGEGKTARYTYDVNGRLEQATIQTSEGNSVETYGYDFAGNRIEKTTDGLKTTYILDTSSWLSYVLCEVDQTGTPIATYTRGNELISKRFLGEEETLEGFSLLEEEEEGPLNDSEPEEPEESEDLPETPDKEKPKEGNEDSSPIEPEDLPENTQEENLGAKAKQNSVAQQELTESTQETSKEKDNEDSGEGRKEEEETESQPLPDENTEAQDPEREEGDSTQVPEEELLIEPFNNPETAPKVRYYHYDGHGDVRFLTNERGTITDTYTFDAFGNLTDQTGDTENDYLYCGEQFDRTTGLYYLRARYMNPKTGGFISMDEYSGSIFDPVSLHKYLYANANPVTYKDPSGYFTLAEVSVSMSISTTLREAHATAMFSGLLNALHTFMSGGSQGDVLNSFFGGIGAGYLFGGVGKLAQIGPMMKGFMGVYSLGGIGMGYLQAYEDFEKGNQQAGTLMLITSSIGVVGWAKAYFPKDVASKFGSILKDKSGRVGLIKGSDGSKISVRDELLNSIENSKLKNVADQIYRPGASHGDGGLADAVRYELSTGEYVGGKSHLLKATERVKNLQNVINKQNLNHKDLEIANKLLINLKNALEGN